mgnify:CR=1 FL=1
MFKNIAIISKNDDNSVKDSLDTVINYLDKKKIKYFARGKQGNSNGISETAS